VYLRSRKSPEPRESCRAARSLLRRHGLSGTPVVSENGSGANDRRPKVLELLADPAILVIVVEQKDQATRFGFRYLEMLLE
jgi:putative resolvase